MTLSTWLLYAATVLLLAMTPGPSVLYCITTSVNLGRRNALVAAAGSTTAIVGIMTLSALGLGAALAASESLFNALKWCGAVYLVYLGVTALRSEQTDILVADGSRTMSSRRVFSQGLLVGASNPKALLFFTAFFPQFIDPGTPYFPQFLVLGATFVVLELSLLTVYVLSAARAKRWLQQPRRATLFNRVTGIVFIAAAGLLAISKRAAA